MCIGGGLKVDKDQLIIVNSDVVPAVVLKVIEAKRLLSKNKAKNSTEACKMVDISRSAYYKYKDKVFIYEDKSKKSTTTLYLKLSDEPGILSTVLQILYEHGANILTVNQNISIESVADVTITLKLGESSSDYTKVRNALTSVEGVVDYKRL